MPQLAINGEQIFYSDEGTGPPIVLSHSLGTSSYIWESTVTALVPRFRAITFDCRGHGRSSNHGGFSVEAIADDVLALASALDLPRFNFVGISMSGLVGVTSYNKAPERFISLTLADTFASTGPAGPARIVATRETLKTTSMREFAANYVRDTLMPETPKPVHERAVDAISAVRAENYLQTAEAIFTADVTPMLASILLPTLVIVGEHDQRTPVVVSERLAAAITGARLIVVPEAGHLAMLDQPECFNDALLAFLVGTNEPIN